MKLCAVCKVQKPLGEFYKRSDSPDGYRSDCKPCRSANTLKNHYANHEAKKAQFKAAHAKRKAENPNLAAELYAKHREKDLERSKLAYQANAEDRKAKQRLWSKTNRGTANALAKRYKLKKVNATPKWLSESQLLNIKCKYQLAAMLNVHGVEAWHVDHIVPIRGKDVCGLHVPWNLRVIPAKENMTKGNKLWLL
jgi:hypothetical protein